MHKKIPVDKKEGPNPFLVRCLTAYGFDGADLSNLTEQQLLDLEEALISSLLKQRLLLRDYGKEVYALNKAISVEELVESHRRQREKIVENNKEYQQRIAKGYAFGKAQGYESVVEGYIKLDDLRDMTLAQLVNRLHKESDSE